MINLQSVDYDEMAFAMALFDGAVRGHVRLPSGADVRSASGREIVETLDDCLAVDALRSVLDLTERHPTEDDALTFAMAVLWHHYQDDERQQAICSRILAFHNLLVQMGSPHLTADRFLYRNAESPCIQIPVVQAIASAPLDDSSQFDEASFPYLIADRRNNLEGTSSGVADYATATPSLQAPARVRSSAWEFAKLLYIFETCALPPTEQGNFLRFAVLKKLCTALARIGGSRALQGIMARALATTRREFPWFEVAKIAPTGDVKWDPGVPPALTPPQAVEGELALVGSLVQLMRSVLGDDVTENLLRSIWPLASFPRRATGRSVSDQAGG